MIIKTYKCDLCASDVEFPDGGYFVRFSGCGGIDLVPLTQEQGCSGRIICRECCPALKAALNRLEKPFS